MVMIATAPGSGAESLATRSARPRLFFSSICLLGSTALCDPVLAQDHHGRSSTAVDGTSVVVEGRRDPTGTDVYEAPASTVVIPLETIERFGHPSPGDVLKGQPGVQVGDVRNGGAIDVNIRGVQGQSRVAVLIDGSQQAVNAYRGYAGTQQRSYIDADLLGSITIDKGPGLAPNAAGAVGGVVNMTTLGTDDIVEDGRAFGVRLRGAMSDNGITHPDVGGVAPRDERPNFSAADAKAGSIAAAFRGPAIDVVAAYAQRRQGNYFAGTHGRDRYRRFSTLFAGTEHERVVEDGTVASTFNAGEEVFNTSNQSDSALLKATVRPSASDTLDIAYRSYLGRNGEIMPSAILRNEGTLPQFPIGRIDLEAVTARYAHRPDGNKLLNITATAWTTTTASRTVTHVDAPQSQLIPDIGYAWERLVNRRRGFDASNVSDILTAAGRFTLQLGGSYQFEDVAPADSVEISEDDIHRNRVLRDGTRREASVVAELRYRPSDTLTVTAGGRYSAFRMRDRNRYATKTLVDGGLSRTIYFRDPATDDVVEAADWLADEHDRFDESNRPATPPGTVADVLAPVRLKVPRYDLAAPVTREDGGFGPMAGISVKPTPSTLVYANYVVGLRLPSLFETTMGTAGHVTSGRLAPERARSIELGASMVRHKLFTGDDEAAIKLAYFDTSISDYITRYYLERDDLLVFANADRFVVSGFELQSSYQSRPFFADVSATYYARARTCDAAQAARLRSEGLRDTPDCIAGGFSGSYANTQNPPKLAVNATWGRRFFDQKLTLGARATHTSGPVNRIDAPANGRFTTFQLYYRGVTTIDAFAALKLGTRATLNASIDNLTDRFYLDPLAQSILPAPGRTVRASVSLKL